MDNKNQLTNATPVGAQTYDGNGNVTWSVGTAQPFLVSALDEKEFGYLKSMTPAEELKTFLSLRGHCLLAMGKFDEAIAAHEAALCFAPDCKEQQLILAAARKEVTLRRTRLDLLPPEQLQRGAIPLALDSREMQFARAQQRTRLISGGVATPASGQKQFPDTLQLNHLTQIR